MSAPVLYLVVPCYNEHEVLSDTAEKLAHKLTQLIDAGKISERSRIAFVNDGSSDRTWEIIRAYTERSALFSGINLAHNEGHQNALLAGLMTVLPYADVTISMDADLQDDINAVDAMLEKYAAGVNIVYGVRANRSSDTFFKRFTAESFYRAMRALGADIVFNHADFRLMDRRALTALAEYPEVNLFLRGIVPMIGLTHGVVYYARKERLAGVSKYPWRRMASFAWEGVTSLSARPIRLIAQMGMFISFISGLMLIWSIVRHFIGETVVGWTSLVVSLWFLGGLILLSVGVIGEYVAKIYLEVKRRPRYLVQDFIDGNAEQKHDF
ncbi:glycosyltransferase, group 2 family protein [Selenomonas noxia ATCC 43541]|uniref:glycosyltransferase family 2 protein n=1 Tax=Selenomonas noxia TaxID=135083 RepID=UPI0001BCC827|nr:glycosyltransferase family 2 protein [Selenomonas noxia]EFF66461.1 glycosyltransferase, group 2 family protein [Selenomonas noxia ATCC 43541]